MTSWSKGKIITLIIFAVIIIAVFFRYFYYVDFKNGCYVKIKPSIFELSSQNIKEAILVLKNAVPGEYEKFCSHVKAINPNMACGGFGGGCYYGENLKKKEIDISTANSGYLGWTAAVVAHETCHAIQGQNNKPISEDECYKINNEVLKKVISF
jgi:hypothetical protein